MNNLIALYARVSSEKQMQAQTIESQLSQLREKIHSQGNIILKDNEFVDDGYSGSTLLRPGLEQLRDTVANGLVNKVYVHSPDRLARKYAYQYLLMEEFERSGVELIFLNHQLGHNPESDLLLQVQGIIAEYERMKIMERARRGKQHAAKNGSPSILSGAPYGYRYIAKRETGSVIYEIVEQEAEVIRQIFHWMGHDRVSINEITKRLTDRNIPTPTRHNSCWNRATVHRLLRNPAFKGQAAYGKTRCIEKKQLLRPHKGQPAQSKSITSTIRTVKSDWIYIPVPAIVEAELFDKVQLQLEENRRLKRARKTGARYLLQSLVVCLQCGYGYYGNTARGAQKFNYYTCGGTRTYPHREKRRCHAKSVYANELEQIVWDEIIHLLQQPKQLQVEYERRLQESKLSQMSHP